MLTVNLKSKLAAFSDHWSPKIVGELATPPRHRKIALHHARLILQSPPDPTKEYIKSGAIRNLLLRQVF